MKLQEPFLNEKAIFISDLGVFAKKAIPKRTHFGPFISELVATQDQVTNQGFPLKIERDDGQTLFLEPMDENACNWMMFVRPAKSYSEQNLVAFQYNNDIFFVTIKNIEPRQELKVSTLFSSWDAALIQTWQ